MKYLIKLLSKLFGWCIFLFGLIIFLEYMIADELLAPNYPSMAWAFIIFIAPALVLLRFGYSRPIERR